MNNYTQSLLSGIGQEQVFTEASKESALEQVKAAEVLLIDVTKQAINQALEKASNKGASPSELTYMAVIAGNASLAGHPLMQAAFNGFFKDLFSMSINELTAAGTVLSESTGSSQRYRLSAMND